MRLAIMQPYFLPYIGYWQLMNEVDTFVIYDNIQYTKKGWINRNRVLNNGKDTYLTIPLEKASDYLNIIERRISKNFDKDKLFNQISQYYKKAKNFDEGIIFFEKVLMFQEDNLFEFILNSIKEVCNYLNIKTPVVISSKINIDHTLKGRDKVIAICKELKASEYINSIGGIELYDKVDFQNEDIELSFIQTKPFMYNQGSNEFVQFLSILDVIMYNTRDEVKSFLQFYNKI